MTKEKLFEYAVGLVRADIAAGALERLANPGDYIADKVVLAYEALERAWEDVRLDEGEANADEAGTYN